MFYISNISINYLWFSITKITYKLGSLTLLFKLHKPDTLKYHRLR